MKNAHLMCDVGTGRLSVWGEYFEVKPWTDGRAGLKEFIFYQSYQILTKHKIDMGKNICVQ